MSGVVVLTTTPNIRAARELARRLLAKKLAACVSVQNNLLSYYRWKNKVAQAREILLLIKTDKRSFKPLKNEIKRGHAYDVPEVIALPIVNGSKDYLKWIKNSLK